jgi:hypothetical protein
VLRKAIAVKELKVTEARVQNEVTATVDQDGTRAMLGVTRKNETYRLSGQIVGLCLSRCFVATGAIALTVTDAEYLTNHVIVQ